MSANKTSLLLEKVSKKEKIVRENDKSSNDTLLLLANNEKQQEVNILKQIGLDTHIREVQKQSNDLTRIQVLEEKYKGRNVYTGKQIKQICNENGLKLLRADSFSGKVPVEFIGRETLKFVEENTREVTEKKRKKGYVNDDFENDKESIVYEEITKKVVDVTVTERSFFILSTTKSFKGKAIESATLFYREDSGDYDINRASEKDIFIEICSWGKSFNSKFVFIDYMMYLGNDGENLGVINFLTILISIIALIVGFIKGCNLNYLFLTGFIFTTLAILLTSNDTYFNNWKTLKDED